MASSGLRYEAGNLRRAAEDALAAALTRGGVVDLDGDRRCATPELNLVSGIGLDRWSVIAQQLGGGNGGELHAASGRRPKFCSAFSSCALAVNTFGRFDEAETLALPGMGSYGGGVEFEAQRSAGVRGYRPNLDLVAEPPDSDWLFAESKCLEYLGTHATDFSGAFVTQAEKVLCGETAGFFAAFAQDEKQPAQRYEFLDAAQLLKHFLAAKKAAAGQRTVTLTYLFWEPADAADHEVFSVHRQEAENLAGALRDDHVRLVPLSYRELWVLWEALNEPGLADHVAALRARYDVTVGPMR